MTSLYLTIAIIGLLMDPICEWFGLSQRKKPGSKFSDTRFYKKYITSVRIVSFALLLTALIIYKVKDL